MAEHGEIVSRVVASRDLPKRERDRISAAVAELRPLFSDAQVVALLKAMWRLSL